MIMECEGLKVKEINTYFHPLGIAINEWIGENQNKIIIKTEIVLQNNHATLFLIWYKEK